MRNSKELSLISKWLSIIISQIYVKKLVKIINVLSRVTPYINISKRRIIVNAFLKSQFSYYPLVWMCHSRTNHSNINRITNIASVYFILIRYHHWGTAGKTQLCLFSQQKSSGSCYWNAWVRQRPASANFKWDFQKSN